MTDEDRCFRVNFNIVTPEPFLHTGRREGILVGQEGDFECAFCSGRSGRNQAEHQKKQDQRHENMTQEKEPGLTETELRHFDVRIAGKVDRTLVIQNRQNQYNRSAQQEKI